MKKKLILFFIFFIFNFLNAANDSFIMGHITTCTGLINNYPADSVNWFYRKSHKVVQYFAYILFPLKKNFINLPFEKKYFFKNPYEIYSKGFTDFFETEFTFENRWLSPSGKVLCEKIINWSLDTKEKKFAIEGIQYIPYVFANYIGISEKFAENGQKELPAETGLYHINLYINSELKSITFFEIKD